MNNDTWIGKKGFRYWYYRFRDSEYYGMSVIAFTLFVCFMLIFKIIIPEINQWFSIRDEVIATRQRIATLQQNISFINNLDKNTLNDQLTIVSHALPPEKNFGYVLNALSAAAANSGVSFGDYAFQVGSVSLKGGTKNGDIQQHGLSIVQLTIVVNGNLNSIKHFIESVETKLPISEVTTVNGSGNSVSLRMQFYQKQFPNVSYSGDQPLQGLSTKNTQLLQNLKSWDSATADQNAPDLIGSNSAVPLF